MKKTSSKYIEDYYERVKDQYPHINIESFKEICRAPFILVKKEMERGTLKNIRIKYFAEFRVFPGRVKGAITSLEERFTNGKIDKESYDEYIQILRNYEE
jgi:hypothetical protein